MRPLCTHSLFRKIYQSPFWKICDIGADFRAEASKFGVFIGYYNTINRPVKSE